MEERTYLDRIEALKAAESRQGRAPQLLGDMRARLDLFMVRHLMECAIEVYR